MSQEKYDIHREVVTELSKKWHPDLVKNISLVAGVSTNIFNLIVLDSNLKRRERHSIYDLFLTKGNSPAKQLEIIAKNLVYRELKVNAILFTKATLYQVMHVVATDRGFLGVLFFEHFTEKWYFAIKGSGFTFEEMDSASSYYADLEWFLGKSAWLSARDLVLQMIKDFKIEKLCVCGHSLGALLAELMTAEMCPIVDELYLFNGPGVPTETHILFKEKAR
jgi:hypothetical protein